MMNYRLLFFHILICVLTITSCQTQEPPTTTDNNVSLTRAKQTLDSLYSNYSAPGTCLLREYYPSNVGNYAATYLVTAESKDTPNQYSFLWPYAGTFSAVNALFAATKDTVYKSLLDSRILVGLEEYFDNERTPEGYATYIRNTYQPERFYDDNTWVGIEFMNLYLLTKEPKYLQKAQLLWKFIESGSDDTLGGGIYWCEQKKETKNTCSNAPASVLAFKLFKATGDSAYFDRGKFLYEWTQTHFQDSTDYLYFDNITLEDGKMNKAKYAYNSSQMMLSSTLLYQLTGEKKYLAEAQNIAKSCHNYFFMDYTPENGNTFKLIKKGDIWFTAVMLRGFVELYRIDKNKTYLNTYEQCLDFAWNHARAENGLFNTDFSGDTRDSKRWLLTQAAMVEMYARMAAINSKN